MLYQVSRISWIRITSFHPHSHQSPTLQRRAQLGAEGTWDKPERKPNGLLLHCLLYQLEAFIPLQPAWIIQWLYPFSLGCGPQPQKEPYCCWFVSMRRLSAAKENIKKQLIRRRAKERRSRRAPGGTGAICSVTWKREKDTEKMAFSVTSAHLCRWMSDGREDDTNKGRLQSA